VTSDKSCAICCGSNCYRSGKSSVIVSTSRARSSTRSYHCSSMCRSQDCFMIIFLYLNTACFMITGCGQFKLITTPWHQRHFLPNCAMP
jgi:hypothetical protein